MILIINGSPNKNSKTMTMTNEIIKNVNQKVTILNPYEMSIKSCDDCKYCEKKIGCIKQDDMNLVYKLLEEADTLIISSPIYFGAFTDNTMKLINRFQRYYGQKFGLKDSNIPSLKNLITITSQGSKKRMMFSGVNLTTQILVSLFKPHYTKSIHATNSDNELPLKFKKITNLCKKVASKIEEKR